MIEHELHTYLGIHDNYNIIALVAVNEQTFDQYYDMLNGCLREGQTLFSVEMAFQAFQSMYEYGLEPRYLNAILHSPSYKTVKKIERNDPT